MRVTNGNAFALTATICLMLSHHATGKSLSVEEEPAAAMEFVRAARYCMADACLGMAPEELADRGKLTFWPQKDGEDKPCRIDDWKHAEFVTRDGTKLTLGFRGYPYIGTGSGHYRLAEIALYLPITELQLDELRRTLTDRRPMTQNRDKVGQWTVEAPLADISLAAAYNPRARNQALILSLTHQRFAVWLQSPTCSVDLPKL